MKTLLLNGVFGAAVATSILTLYAQQKLDDEFHPKPEDVRGSFQQIGRNCPSVAVAKWVISNYGVNTHTGPFSDIPAQSGVSLILGDAKTLLVTEAQLELASTHSRYSDKKTNDYEPTLDTSQRRAIIRKANILYAAEAIMEANDKDRGKIQNGNMKVFEARLKDLDASKHEVDADFRWLGLDPIDIESFVSNPRMFVFGNERNDQEQPHVAFGYIADEMSFYDEYGTAATLASFEDQNHSGGVLFWRYALLGTGNGLIQVGRQCAFPAKDGTYKWIKDPAGKGTCRD